MFYSSWFFTYSCLQLRTISYTKVILKNRIGCFNLGYLNLSKLLLGRNLLELNIDILSLLCVLIPGKFGRVQRLTALTSLCALSVSFFVLVGWKKLNAMLWRGKISKFANRLCGNKSCILLIIYLKQLRNLGRVIKLVCHGEKYIISSFKTNCTIMYRCEMRHNL